MLGMILAQAAETVMQFGLDKFGACLGAAIAAIGAGIGGYGITIFGMRTIWISCMLLLIGFLMMFIKEEQTEHMEPMTL